MPNVHDHALAVGGQSLDERPFDALDALILTQLVYMPFDGWLADGASRTLREARCRLEACCDYEALDVFQKKRYRLFQACAELLRYADWRMTDYTNLIDADMEMQFCACTYIIRGGHRFIAFRGTDLTLAGWKEDLNMSFMTVPSQKEAAEYVLRAAERCSAPISLGGHSKGGNLAVYAGVHANAAAQERIRRVYSFDGPGLDGETMTGAGYALIADRIESYIPQSSVVGMLLHYHPVYTVVKAKSAGLLQHDALTWQVKDGGFVVQKGLDIAGKITDEALHSWLQSMNMDDRRLLVDTLYKVVDAGHAELVTELVDDWRDHTVKALEVIRELSPEVKRDVRRMIKALFSTGASEVVRMALPQLAKLGRAEEK